MLIVESAGLTDTGRKRKANEDSFVVDDAHNLYVVADGMGGHAAGEVASRVAVETISSYIRNLSQKHPEELPIKIRGVSRQANRLLAGLHLANRSVYDLASNNPRYAGMGTTISAVLLTGRTFITANVGDSPIFLVRDDQIEMVSTLHTVASAAAAANPDGEPLDNEFKHMLTQAVGTKTSVAPDTVERKCQEGDTIVISSDGLTDMLSLDEIRDTVTVEKPVGACQKLVELANLMGGLDNITVIVIKIKKVAKNVGLLSRFQKSIRQIIKP
ncbi:MAG: protein phosphatase 2C domain-containing protein [Thermodesulfobacteriota bacterium]